MGDQKHLWTARHTINKTLKTRISYSVAFYLHDAVSVMRMDESVLTHPRLINKQAVASRLVNRHESGNKHIPPNVKLFL